MTGTFLDDIDSRRGSATSLLRTFIGLAFRDFGGWMAVADLVYFMQQLGVDAPRTRTAIVRVKEKGLLVGEVRGKRSGYRLHEDAAPMLRRGDRRIFEPRTMAPGDPWCLVSFSMPESQRRQRHQLRRHLHWVGCGMVASGLWIAPGYLAEDIQEILEDLELAEQAVIFPTADPVVAGGLAAAVQGWWDFPEIEGLHRDFVSSHAADGRKSPSKISSEQAFSLYLRAVDSWRLLSYLDPGIPAQLLPAGWPGAESLKLFVRLRDLYSDRAYRWARSTLIERATPEERLVLESLQPGH